jgi:hypothetical protein
VSKRLNHAVLEFLSTRASLSLARARKALLIDMRLGQLTGSELPAASF